MWPDSLSRREFVKVSAAVAGGGLATAALGVPTRGRDSVIRVGVIGCGGRGTGAAVNALEASRDTVIWALADVFADRVDGCRSRLAGLEGAMAGRGSVPAERCYAGFDCFQRLIDGGVDVVILASPPHFRPMHLAAAVGAGCHVFTEKPVAVDGPGVRSVFESHEVAESKGLCIVAGTQRRYETSYLQAMARIKAGAIGRIVSASCYWNQGGLWVHERRPEWSDMEWQLRNWLYFTWLSGDHIVEQHVHNLDVVNWATGAHPIRCTGMGGRQVRTSPAYGHIFDHFAVEYEYPGGVRVTSMCRQIDGCASRVEEVILGTRGRARLWPGYAKIEGDSPWTFDESNNNPYVHEHVELFAAIANGRRINEARQVAESTLTAIMGRMSAYTGKEVSWDQALNSAEDLRPSSYEFGTLATPSIATPGKTPLA